MRQLLKTVLLVVATVCPASTGLAAIRADSLD